MIQVKALEKSPSNVVQEEHLYWYRPRGENAQIQREKQKDRARLSLLAFVQEEMVQFIQHLMSVKLSADNWTYGFIILLVRK